MRKADRRTKEVEKVKGGKTLELSGYILTATWNIGMVGGGGITSEEKEVKPTGGDFKWESVKNEKRNRKL